MEVDKSNVEMMEIIISATIIAHYKGAQPTLDEFTAMANKLWCCMSGVRALNDAEYMMVIANLRSALCIE